jgi:hypothetical protein
VWWCTPVIPALWRLEGRRITNSKPAWARDHLKKKKKPKQQQQNPQQEQQTLI